MPIHIATIQDIPLLEALLNSAYRGDESKKGWTSEADLLQGEIRTDAGNLMDLMKTKDAAFLKYANEANKIEGCVFLHKQGDRLYLGMLSVSPLSQARGIGRQLMNEAIFFAREKNCSSIYMKVISVRHELIAWYEKQGFKKTGKQEPFPTDNRFGIPTQLLEFEIMEKIL
jgi:ribosomal protein S18 acetylase RimI-like enzyme